MRRTLAICVGVTIFIFAPLGVTATSEPGSKCGITGIPKHEPAGGTDACCYRDPGTGRMWCWC
jgi:hypothetical protein